VSEAVSVRAALPAPWLAEGPAVAVELDADPAQGLTGAEATTRLERFGPNRLEAAAEVPAWRRLLAQFADPLVYLLLAAVAISATCRRPGLRRPWRPSSGWPHRCRA
jgi:magnesium-transporting ATPase (P-type)